MHLNLRLPFADIQFCAPEFRALLIKQYGNYQYSIFHTNIYNRCNFLAIFQCILIYYWW